MRNRCISSRVSRFISLRACPDMTFGEWLDFWYQNYSKPKLRPKSQGFLQGFQLVQTRHFRLCQHIFCDGKALVIVPKTKAALRTIVLPPALVGVLVEYRQHTNSRWMFACSRMVWRRFRTVAGSRGESLFAGDGNIQRELVCWRYSQPRRRLQTSRTGPQRYEPADTGGNASGQFGQLDFTQRGDDVLVNTVFVVELRFGPQLRYATVSHSGQGGRILRTISSGIGHRSSPGRGVGPPMGPRVIRRLTFADPSVNFCRRCLAHFIGDARRQKALPQRLRQHRTRM